MSEKLKKTLTDKYFEKKYNGKFSLIELFVEDQDYFNTAIKEKLNAIEKLFFKKNGKVIADIYNNGLNAYFYKAYIETLINDFENNASENFNVGKDNKPNEKAGKNQNKKETVSTSKIRLTCFCKKKGHELKPVGEIKVRLSDNAIFKLSTFYCNNTGHYYIHTDKVPYWDSVKSVEKTYFNVPKVFYPQVEKSKDENSVIKKDETKKEERITDDKMIKTDNGMSLIPWDMKRFFRCYCYDTKPSLCKREKCQGSLHRAIITYSRNKMKYQVDVLKCDVCQLYYVENGIFNEVPYLFANIATEASKGVASKTNTNVSINDKADIRKTSFDQDTTISEKDFVVRRNIKQCLNNKHELKDITGTVKVLTKYGTISIEKVSASYCKQCNRYYIMDYTYEALKSKGTLLCRVSDEKTYKNNNNSYSIFDDFNQESFLRQFGYNVSEKDGLDETVRHVLLAILIDKRILTKTQIIDHLSSLISFRKNMKNMAKAVGKWETDIQFLNKYKSGEYAQYGIKSITKYSTNKK